MSGGHFNYEQYNIINIYESIQCEIDDPENQERYSPETITEFNKAVDILKKAYVYAQRIDYLLSCDDGEESFHRRLKKELEGL